MPGARYVRADLHVHTFTAPGEPIPAVAPSVEAMIAKAKERGIAVIGITDHNSVANARAAVALGSPTLLVLPGIEVTTAEGDLLALFGSDSVDALEKFARELDLLTVAGGARRSSKSIVQLVREAHDLGGLAIAAHVDTGDGLLARASNATKTDLLIQPGLVGLEFTRRDLVAAFSPEDPDSVRRGCWEERRKALGRRAPIARIMSSDAHTPDDVGREEPHRSLTRLRIDDLNFVAVGIALRDHPLVRCRLEEPLPPSYARLIGARFSGGFLDGVALDFSPNFNCFIGSRGSGKTTALRAVQLALGAVPQDDEDDQANMPDHTEVTFLDALGSQRVVVRSRSGEPEDAAAPGVRLTLRFHDLEQNVGREFLDEPGDNPVHTTAFLDRFCDFAEIEAREAELLTQLGSNGEVLRRTGRATGQIAKLRKEKAELEGALKAATAAKLELVAKYAQVLTRERELREAMRGIIDPLPQHALPMPRELTVLASEYAVDLEERPIKDILGGDAGLSKEWDRLRSKIGEVERSVRSELTAAVDRVRPALEQWNEQHEEWDRRVEERRKELRSAGLTLELGELDRLRRRLAEVDRDVRTFTAWETEYKGAFAKRKDLLKDVYRQWEKRFQLRERVAKELGAALTEQAPSLHVNITWRRGGMRRGWGDWLGRQFNLRSPRSERLADCVTPSELAEIAWRRDTKKLASLNLNGERFFDDDAEGAMEKLFRYEVLFEIETMRLGDRPEIRVRQTGEPSGPGLLLRQRSLGQIRSVILGFTLASKDDAPLILDQPEDHLDALFLSETVVRYLHSAKERRQIVVATHSANLAVLGDAELVLPLEPTGTTSHVADAGSVDNPRTQDWVVRLLEGGRDAYRSRGERYGFRFRDT